MLPLARLWVECSSQTAAWPQNLQIGTLLDLTSLVLKYEINRRNTQLSHETEMYFQENIQIWQDELKLRNEIIWKRGVTKIYSGFFQF